VIGIEGVMKKEEAVDQKIDLIEGIGRIDQIEKIKSKGGLERGAVDVKNDHQKAVVNKLRCSSISEK
jgi:hypothetical protein